MLIVGSHWTPDAVAPSIRAEVLALDAEIPLNAMMPLDLAMTGSRWGHRVFGGMLTAFAFVGLLLGAVGLYAVTAFAVVQRTQKSGFAWLSVRGPAPSCGSLSGGAAAGRRGYWRGTRGSVGIGTFCNAS